jgi:hypothetical protein
VKWIVSEHSISEHVPEFTLKLPKNYQILSVLIKGNPTPNNPMAGGPYLYVKSPEGGMGTELVQFVQVESGQSVEGPYHHVGSYQERGYHKVKHLFMEVNLGTVE